MRPAGGSVTPVCANCGIPVRLGAQFCPGCSAPARFVCPACGSPARAGAVNCPGCGAPFDRRAGATPPAIPQPPSWPPAEPVSAELPTAPAAVPTAPVPVPDERRPGPSRAVLGVAAALAVVSVAFVLAHHKPKAPTATPRPTPGPADVMLQAAGSPDLGFAVSVPRGWGTKRDVDQGRPVIEHWDPASGPAANPKRAFDVIQETTPLDDARRLVADTVARHDPKYAEIRIQDGLDVGGRRAFRHEFFEGDVRFDQWWIERPGGTFRLTLWEPSADYEQAAILNDRILATFRVL